MAFTESFIATSKIFLSIKSPFLINKSFFSPILPFIWAIRSYNNSINQNESNRRENYVNACIGQLKSDRYSIEQKRSFCSCAHDYLFSKYQDKIYNDDFVIPTEIDSIYILECLLKENNLPGFSGDSIMGLLNN